MANSEAGTVITEAQEFAQGQHADSEHANRVRNNSLTLFDLTQHRHGLGPRERILLEVAAVMHDVGYTNRPSDHHKGSRDLILKSGIAGLAAEETKMVACVARYHTKVMPDPSHKVYGDLADRDKAVVDQLAALLRIADGLDRSHQDSIEKLSLEETEGLVRLCVRQKDPNWTDIFGAQKKSDLFEKVFGVRIEIVAN